MPQSEESSLVTKWSLRSFEDGEQASLLDRSRISMWTDGMVDVIARPRSVPDQLTTSSLAWDGWAMAVSLIVCLVENSRARGQQDNSELMI